MSVRVWIGVVTLLVAQRPARADDDTTWRSPQVYAEQDLVFGTVKEFGSDKTELVGRVALGARFRWSHAGTERIDVRLGATLHVSHRVFGALAAGPEAEVDWVVSPASLLRLGLRAGVEATLTEAADNPVIVTLGPRARLSGLVAGLDVYLGQRPRHVISPASDPSFHGFMVVLGAEESNRTAGYTTLGIGGMVLLGLAVFASNNRAAG